MSVDLSTIAKRAIVALKTARSRVECRARAIVEARKRRLEHDRQFYRELRAYCRAHNVSHVCEDDWKTRAAD